MYVSTWDLRNLEDKHFGNKLTTKKTIQLHQIITHRWE